MKPKLLVLDASSLIYRACYSPAPMLRSPTGEPTRGLLVLTKTLVRLAREWQPDYLCAALDAPRDALRRKQVDPGYKANRRSAGHSDEIRTQVDLCLQAFRELQIPATSAHGFEADDVIATVVARFGRNVDSYAVSCDKDLHQLVRSNVFCLDPFSNTIWDYDAVTAKWGVQPERVVEVQTLAGDPTDSVRGVPGIGPKRALELVSRFGSARGAWDHREGIARGLYGSARGARGLSEVSAADIARTRSLVSLDRNVPLPWRSSSEIAFTGFKWDSAKSFFNKLGFQQWRAWSGRSVGSGSKR